MSARPGTGDRVSEYLLVEKVGEGGFGEVWKARHHLFERDVVAIKFPTDPSFASQLRVEGRLQHDLAHPHIVHTVGLDPAADPPYFVMEWVEGESLRQAIRARTRLGFAAALEVAAQVLEALAHAHARGVVHRDVKPENVLVAWAPSPCAEADGDAAWKERTHRTLTARVTDFGLGRATQAAARSLYLSGSASTPDGRSIAGTIAYMAPEQKRGVDSGPRADVWAVGMLLYEAAAGVPPEGVFRDLSRIDAEAPAWADAWVRRCLAQDPEDRFADGGDALATLRADVGGPPPHVEPPPSGPRPARLLVRERRLWVAPVSRLVTVPITVENAGDLLLSASAESQTPWISSPTGDVTIKGTRNLDVQVDPSRSGATEDAPADGAVLVRSNGGEASVRVRVERLPGTHPIPFLLGAALAYAAWLPGWWEAMSFLGLSAGVWVWSRGPAPRDWGITEAVLEAWTMRCRMTWYLAGVLATLGAIALATYGR